MSKDELLKKIREDELEVLICCPGSTPRLKIDIVLRECALCHQVVHMDANNVDKARGMTIICVPCYMTELMAESPIAEQSALVGGQQLTFKEGLQAVMAMIKPSKEEN